VDARHDAQLERLVAVLGAPHVRRADPEHLALRERAQSGQQRLLAVTINPLV
jgi:hypothetical protein